MTNDIEITLNKISQNIVTYEWGKQWFTSQSPEIQHDIIMKLCYVLQQAGARDADVPDAIRLSGLKETFTPCVLLRKGIKDNLSKVINLPTNEWLKVFCILIAIFSIADERRRNTKCNNGCSHWWHQKDFYKNETGTDL